MASRDAALGDNVRAYLFAGAQHTPGAFPPAAAGRGQQRANPVDYTLSLRALLVALDRWVREGVAPPGMAGNLTFSARTIAAGRRAANALLPSSGGEGAVQPLLVSQVDGDGNEISGIRLPEVAVPLATYTGWNFRSPQIGGTSRLIGNTGSYIPFARTRAEREASGDSRRSIEERYPSRGSYLNRVRDVTAALVRERYLLPEDVDAMVQRAYEHWELAAGATTTSASVR